MLIGSGIGVAVGTSVPVGVRLGMGVPVAVPVGTGSVGAGPVAVTGAEAQPASKIMEISSKGICLISIIKYDNS
jgi:hypothetical protein